MKSHIAYFDQSHQDNHLFLSLKGLWTVYRLFDMEKKLMSLKAHEHITLDGTHMEAIDMTGAFIIHKFIKTRKNIHLCHMPEKFSVLCHDFDKSSFVKPLQLSSFSCLKPIESFGHFIIQLKYKLDFVAFLGHFIMNVGRIFKSPFKLTALSHHLYHTSVTALPIVGLISFLIGIVLVYQGAYQLKRFGAEIFTVDLLSVSLLREIGILLTAIVVAGRSGSAFTAQLGTMKLNQEIDALVIMGLNIHSLLIIPRILSLVVGLPLLTFYADVMGLLGGAVMCHYYIGLGYDQFFHQLHVGLQPMTFWIGMIKAPFFALLMGLIGCYEGLNVSGGAESVGQRTTSSVVKSIFMVIVMDAFFSIFFSQFSP